MENIAYLVKGVPNVGEDYEKFNLDMRRDLDIMKSIAAKEGYHPKIAGLDGLKTELEVQKEDSNVIFYFWGHSNPNKSTMWNGVGQHYQIEDLSKDLSRFHGKKCVILDSCVGGEKFDKIKWPSNSKVLTADLVSRRETIAEILYDAVLLRKKPLFEVSKQMFDSMIYNWVQCKDFH